MDKWDARFMTLARHVAMWSKDPSTKCGAVIVDDCRRVVSMGFNGFARGTDDSEEFYTDREYKLANVIHSEENAILLAGEPVRGHTMYITGMTCSGCCARMIQAGISKVIVPLNEEDAFSYRHDWTGSFGMAYVQLGDAGVSLIMLEATGFDATELMGPRHPFYKEN
jgi:dCMP deaminase